VPVADALDPVALEVEPVPVGALETAELLERGAALSCTVSIWTRQSSLRHESTMPKEQ
jgi:hypothetical protein